MSALRPSLGLTHATAMVVGTIIGASIFVQPSEISEAVPSVSRHAAGLARRRRADARSARSSAPSWRRRFRRPAACTSSCAKRSRRPLGFLWGWAMFWSMHSGIIAAIAMVFARYVATFVPLSDLGIRLRRGRGDRRCSRRSTTSACGTGSSVQNVFTVGQGRWRSSRSSRRACVARAGPRDGQRSVARAI